MISQKEYNEWFKDMLLKFPLKHQYEITEEVYEETQYLNVKILHPTESEKNIVISTYGRELTLFIWKHHEHHDSFEDGDHENEFKELSDYIDDIINDKVFFSTGYRGDTMVYGTASYDLEDLVEDRAEKIEIKSWSGNQDQTIENEG